MNMKKLMAASLMIGVALATVGCAHYGNEKGSKNQSMGEVATDSSITTGVKTALLAEKDVNSLDISVETYNSTVQLSGFVDSQWQIDKAGKVAAGVNGVKHVKNELVRKSN